MSKSSFSIYIMLLVFTVMPIMVKADLLEQISPQAGKLTQKIPANSKIVIAPFDNGAGKKTELSAYVSEVLGVTIANQAEKNIQVISSKQLQALLEEQNLGRVDLEAISQAQRKKLIGVDVLVTGKLTKLGDNYSVLYKVTELKTGKQLASSLLTVKVEEGFEALERKLLPKAVKRHVFNVKGLRAELTSFNVTEDDSAIAISVKFTNSGKENVFIAHRLTPYAALSSDAGYVWQDARATGIETHKNQEIRTPPSDTIRYTEIEAGNELVVNFVFPNRNLKRDKMGNVFGFTTHFIKHGSKKSETFSVSFSELVNIHDE